MANNGTGNSATSGQGSSKILPGALGASNGKTPVTHGVHNMKAGETLAVPHVISGTDGLNDD